MYFFCLPSVDNSHQRGMRAPRNLEKCLAVAEMGDDLATIDMVEKGAAVPLLGGGRELDPRVT